MLFLSLLQSLGLVKQHYVSSKWDASICKFLLIITFLISSTYDDLINEVLEDDYRLEWLS